MSYDANSFRATMMGHGWRELRSVPVKATVLDLDEYAGGPTVVRRGGGKQTSSLRMRGEDGVLYNFRSIDKDAARGLDPLLRETLVAWAQQDQISAIFPMAAIVVAPLLEAADLLHPDPTLVVMPDDPRLDEFREEFTGLLGLIEERPDEGPDGGFAGSSRIVSSERLFERLDEGTGVFPRASPGTWWGSRRNIPRPWTSHGRGGRWTGSFSPVSSGVLGKPSPQISNAA